MHKISSDLAQRRARQLWLADLSINVDWDNLPAQEKRANLVLAKNSLETRLSALPKNSAERKALGEQIRLTNLAIHALRPALKGSKEVPAYFIDVCRERLSGAQYRAIMTEASNRARGRELELAMDAYLQHQLDGGHP